MTAPVPPAERPTRKKPGRIPLRLALVLGVIGVALVIVGSVLLAKNLLNKVDSFARVSVAQSPQSVQLDRTGKYVGYFETPTSASRHATIHVTIADSAHASVPLQGYGKKTSLTYTRDNRYGEALFTFSIQRSGRYTVTVTSTNAPPGTGIALGESIADGLVTGVALIIPGALLIITAIVLLIVGIVRRTSYNKRQRDIAARPQWGYQ